MRRWTVEMVEDRLVEAAAVMRRLPDAAAATVTAAITRMEEALTWLRWLEAEDAKLVWARADRTPWKAICWHFGIARATANRRYQYGLSVIAWRLNGRKLPSKRSRQHVIVAAEGHSEV